MARGAERYDDAADWGVDKLTYGQDTDKQEGPLTRAALNYCKYWLRGVDLNHQPLGYEGNADR